jgi:hypothetical protein
MTKPDTTLGSATSVAVDVAKKHNEVLIEPRAPAGRRRFRIANGLADYERLAVYLRQLGPRTVVGFEATGNYHRPLAYFLIGKDLSCGWFRPWLWRARGRPRTTVGIKTIPTTRR